MELHILIDNLPAENTPSESLCHEHGLCILLCLDGKYWLTDTGASGKALANMAKLQSANPKICTIEEIEAVFISHGHNDHTGGLRKFLEQNTGSAIYLHREIRGNLLFSCRPRQATDDTSNTPIKEFRSIGMEQALFAEYPERFLEVDSITQITEKITLIPISHNKNNSAETPDTAETSEKEKPYPTPMGNEFLYCNDLPDNFSHEMAILVEYSHGKFAVISPCTHNGILNVLERCSNYIALKNQMKRNAPTAPDTGNGEVWCKNGHFSTPDAGNSEVWCKNGHFSAPNTGNGEVGCKNGHFSTPDMESSCAGEIKYFIGGLHYVDYLGMGQGEKEAEAIVSTARTLKAKYPSLKIYSGHCTCTGAGEILKGILGENYSTFRTGTCITAE